MLWPFALKAAEEIHNTLNFDDEDRSPLSKFSMVDSPIRPRNYHTWGCPVYVLDARLQGSNGGPPKWEPRSHLGIYLGHSPYHAGSVALVLNPGTGLVSPQFHVVFDEDFLQLHISGLVRSLLTGMTW